MTLPDWLTSEVSTGTTIMAVEYNGGVILGCDSRTTTGAYIVNRVTNKLTKMTDNIYVCHSGSSADTQTIRDIVSYHLEFHSIEMGELPLVETAANLCREICYNYRSSLSASIIVAGWDARKKAQVYQIPLGGMVVRQKVAIGGSGSVYIMGFIDSNFKENMTKDECVEFVTKAIELAITRDGSSGGVVRIGVLDGSNIGESIEHKIIPFNVHPRFYEG